MTRKEEWRPIPGFESLYFVSRSGKIKSLKRDNTRTPNQFSSKERIKAVKNGYVTLWDKGTSKRLSVASIVSCAFLERGNND